MSWGKLFRVLSVRRGRAQQSPCGDYPPVWAFSPTSNFCDFNLMAMVLPPLPGPQERRRPLIYIEIHEPRDVNHLFVTPEQARQMQGTVRDGLGKMPLHADSVRIEGAPFTRSECRAIERVLGRALCQIETTHIAQPGGC